MADELGVKIAQDSSEYFSKYWNNYQRATGVRRKRLQDFYKQYRGIPNRKNYEGFANVVVNETLEAVESITAQEVGNLFSESKYIMLLPKEETDKEQTRLNELLLLDCLERINHKSKIVRSLRQKNKYGTCWVKVYQDYEEKDVITKESGGQLVKKVVRNVPNYHYVDALDLAYDPGKPDVESMPLIVWRKFMTWDEIKKKEREGLYSKAQVDKIDKKVARKKEYLDQKHSGLSAIGIQYSFFDEDQFEVLEAWGKMPRLWVDDEIDPKSPEAEDLVEGVCECVLDGPTLRLERNPYWHQEKPFGLGHFIQVDDEADGLGVCEISESLQQELNDKRNQVLDHSTDQIFPPLVIDQNKLVTPIDEVEIKPRKKILAQGDPNSAIVPLNVGGNFQEQAYFDATIKQDIRNQTGATNPVQGIQSNKESTAFEIERLTQRGSARIHVSTIDTGEKLLKRVYRLMWSNVNQYYTQEQAIRILGKDGIRWVKMPPERIIENVDIVQRIPTDVDSRSIVRAQMVQFLTAIVPFYPRTNVAKLVRKVYTMFPNSDDVDEVVPEPETELGQNALTNEEELIVLAQGQEIDVKYWEDHTGKIAFLESFLAQNSANLTPQGRSAIQNKLRQHILYLTTLEQMARSGNGGTPKPQPKFASQAQGGGI